MKKEKLPYPAYDDCPRCGGIGVVVLASFPGGTTTYTISIECSSCWKRAHEEGDADNYNPI